MAATLSMVALLAACGTASQQARPTASAAAQAAAYPQPSSYDPPGPASDPWGPYIREASRRFDIPERWIREVMRQESGGRVAARSPVGAMGLMQVMPGTYAELRSRYGLGDDPYHPWNSVMAGTAYVREMYELYGSPGFLAAYNAGPRRLEDYLWNGRGLPAETRNYVARIGPRIIDAHPERRAAPEVYAAAEIPLNIPAGPRRGDTATMLALRDQRNATDPGIRVASLPAGPVIRMEPIPDGSTYAAAAPVQVASLDPAAGSNVVRMEPIPDGSTYASSPAPMPEPPPAAPVASALAAAAPAALPLASPPPPSSLALAAPPPAPPPSPAPAPAPAPSQLASAVLPRPANAAPAPTSQRIATAFAAPAPTPASGLRGFSLVGTAHAATVAPPANVLRLPSRDAAPASAPAPAPTPVATAATGGAWGVQVGAFASANLARTAAGEARSRLGIGSARPAVEQVSAGNGTLYRARVMGLSREHAQSACDKLRSQGACIIVSPGAQG
ncbi:lytic transglycosylase domain-containing protein [Roseomonas sp. USHLN139]|uniref:lytic transglycosylase domain-containing protein n=1 Tax=Roseomonas sp. USHLN139 TaxID=3081298 RepID=UPI003B013CB9